MTARVVTRRIAGLTTGAALLVGFLVSAASGALVLDIRYPGETAIPITSPTQLVEGFQLWAIITGQNANMSDEGLWKFYASFYSSAGGLIKGNISDAWAETPFDDAIGVNLGSQVDLDGDGDLDIGSTNPGSPAPPYFYAKSNAMVTGNEFLIATLSFQGIGWASENPHGVTEIYAVGRASSSSNLWKEDGVNKYGIPVTGTRVVLYRPAEADAGAEEYVVLEGAEPTLFSGSGSVGTITTWAWDFNGDRIWDMFGEKVAVSYDYLHDVLGMEQGTYMVTLRVESQYSQSEDTAILKLVPEPSTALFLALGAVGMALARRRRR